MGRADDVEAGVDVVDLAGDARGKVGAEVDGGVADFLDADVAASGATSRKLGVHL